jgi:hypothetical protein
MATFPYSPTQLLRVGDRVTHPKLGEGEVLEVGPDRAAIRFGVDVKKLMTGGVRPEDPRARAAAPGEGEHEVERGEPADRWLDLDDLRTRFFLPPPVATQERWGPRPALLPEPELARWAGAIEETLAPALVMVPLRADAAGIVGVAAGDEGPGETWPTCGRCTSELDLLFALDLASLAGLLDRSGRLAIWYCLDCYAHLPDGRARELDHLSSSDAADRARVHVRLTDGDLRIAGTARKLRPPTGFMRDPIFFGLAPLWEGPRLRVAQQWPSTKGTRVAQLSDVDIESCKAWVQESIQAAATQVPSASARRTSDCSSARLDGSIGGYAYWEQDDSTPACPACGRPQRYLLIFQGDFWFGDGNLKVFFCDRERACPGLDNPSIVVES